MRKWIASVRRIIVLLLFVLLTIGIAWLALPIFLHVGVGTQSPKASCVNDITQLVVAVKNYKTDYGKYPALATGRFETERANAKLLRILVGLDAVENPRQIRYLELSPAQRRGDIYCNGLDPEGVWRDPWGNPYFLRVDPTGRRELPNPYPDDPPSTIHRDVIAWSVGKDCHKGNPRNKQTAQGSDDILSWHR